MKKGLVLRIAALAIVTSAASVPLGTAAHATVPGGNGKIAFYRWRGHQWGGTPHQIVTMDPDGSNARQITSSPRTSSDYPAWSPDGTQIAYATSVVAHFPHYTIALHAAVRIMDADGSNSRVVIPKEEAFNGVFQRITWSPDGTHLAVVRHNFSNGNPAIYVVGVDGTGLTKLTPSLHFADYNPDWSPDGSALAFTTFDGRGFAVSTMHPDGTARTSLVTRHFPDNASWAPDGTGLAVDLFLPRKARPGFYQEDVVLVNSAGVRTANLTDSPWHHEFGPCYSPNGTKVAYLRGFRPPDIWVVPAAGGAAVQLTDTPHTSEDGLSWQPT